MESNKTRIETILPLSVAAAPGFRRRMESNKTRIETVLEAKLQYSEASQVGGWNPIKQGLKLNDVESQRKAHALSRRMESNKTRIETIFFACLTSDGYESEDGIQ